MWKPSDTAGEWMVQEFSGAYEISDTTGYAEQIQTVQTP